MPLDITAEDLEEKQIFLVLAAATGVRERNVAIIKTVSGLGFSTVVITTNYPYSVLAKLYEQNGVDLSQVMFIDTVTRRSIGSVQDVAHKVRYVSNPANLTDMGIAVGEILKELSGQKACILFDSVSTMLIYLSSQDISKFIHFVTNKLRLMDIAGIFIAVEKGLDPRLLNQITTFVDRIIDDPE